MLSRFHCALVHCRTIAIISAMVPGPLGIPAALAQDDPEEAAARQQVAERLAMAEDAVKCTGSHEAVRLDCYTFSFDADGVSGSATYSRKLGRIVQARFMYAEDYQPDPAWAEMEPYEAMTVHLIRLGMFLPRDVRLKEMQTLGIGNMGSGYRVSLEYERTEGSLAPLWLDGSLDAKDHRPLDLTSVEYPLKVSTEPKVSEDRAISLAKEKTGIANPVSVTTKLRVWFHQDGEQVLWWDVQLKAGGPHEQPRAVLINAHTGEIDHVL